MQKTINDIAQPDGIADERKRRQKIRSIAIGLALLGLVVLFYLATIVHLGGDVANRSM